MLKAWLFIGHAFFAWAAFLFPQAHADACQPPDLESGLQPITLERVVDGDTIRLASGEKLRLIGINTPELAGNEPLSQAARRYLVDLLAAQNLLLLAGEQKRDRHQRLLGHLFLADGQNVEALMLRQGLAYPVAIPPNLALVECHHSASVVAQKAARGVWQWQAKPSHSLDGGDAGFTRVRGRIENFTEAGGSWWLQMQGPLVLRIAGEHQRYFERKLLEQWPGKHVEVTGWMIDRSHTRAGRQYAPLMLGVSHPLHIKLLH